MTHVVIAGFLLVAGAAQGADFVHPKLKAGETEIRTVLMLPAIAEMSKRGVKGVEGMGGEAEESSNLLYAAVSAALQNTGLRVESPFTEQAFKDNDELKYAVADVQRRFDQVAAQLFKKHKDVRKGRFTLGDSVAVLNASGTADALIVIRAEGIQDTKGKAVMKRGVIGLARSGKAEFKSRVALVDARNGDILFLGDYESRGLPKDKTYEKSFQHIRVAQGERPQSPSPMRQAGPVQPEVVGPTVQNPVAAEPPAPVQNAVAVQSPATVQSPAASPEPVTITLGQTIDDVERGLGRPKNIVDLGAKKIYVYPNLKVTFIAGKVSDVE